MTESAADYPYREHEPWTNVRNVEGLERLCYIADRGMAQVMFELYQNIARNEQLMDVAKRAISGMLGEPASELAKRHFGEVLGHPSTERLERFVEKLKQVRTAKAGETRRGT
jgi:hypothetical protein